MPPILPSCHVALTQYCIIPWQQSVATRLIQNACCYGANIHRRNRTYKPSTGPMLGQYKRPDWATRNAITTGPLQAWLQLGQYKRLLELAHIKWLDLAQVQQMRQAFFSTNWLVSSLLWHGGCWWFQQTWQASILMSLPGCHWNDLN